MYIVLVYSCVINARDLIVAGVAASRQTGR